MRFELNMIVATVAVALVVAAASAFVSSARKVEQKQAVSNAPASNSLLIIGIDYVGFALLEIKRPIHLSLRFECEWPPRHLR